MLPRMSKPDGTPPPPAPTKDGSGEQVPPARVVVIDGPAGAGKTTVARRVAAALGLPLLDTGAIYRTLAWVADDRGIAWDDAAALAELTADFPIRFEPAASPGAAQGVFFGERELTKVIRTPHISEGASQVSAHPGVRAGLLGIQRALAASGCVAEGRDMGTVVFPNARHKFFLTADPVARAKRRHAELVERQGEGAPSLDAVTEDLVRRDARDSGREVAPLAKADDAVALDSTTMSADQVIQTILDQVRGASPSLGQG